MHLFGEESLDALKAEKKLTRENFFRKVTLEVAVVWKPISQKERLAFFVKYNTLRNLPNFKKESF